MCTFKNWSFLQRTTFDLESARQLLRQLCWLVCLSCVRSIMHGCVGAAARAWPRVQMPANALFQFFNWLARLVDLPRVVILHQLPLLSLVQSESVADLSSGGRSVPMILLLIQIVISAFFIELLLRGYIRCDLCILAPFTQHGFVPVLAFQFFCLWWYQQRWLGCMHDRLVRQVDFGASGRGSFRCLRLLFALWLEDMGTTAAMSKCARHWHLVHRRLKAFDLFMHWWLDRIPWTDVKFLFGDALCYLLLHLK